MASTQLFAQPTTTRVAQPTTIWFVHQAITSVVQPIGVETLDGEEYLVFSSGSDDDTWFNQLKEWDPQSNSHWDGYAETVNCDEQDEENMQGSWDY